MKKSFVSIVLLMLSIVGFISIDAKADTIATFADPSNDSNTPLFTVDFRPAQMKLTGGWSDANTGLTLEIPYSDSNFANAWFEMTDVVILNTSGDTGGGEINFYADGNLTTPLITIIFQSGYVGKINFGADEFFVGENVAITGSEITGTLSEEEFSFSFANKMPLPGSNTLDDGFTATASFTSSAIPEPATITILSIGLLTFMRKKK